MRRTENGSSQVGASTNSHQTQNPAIYGQPLTKARRRLFVPAPFAYTKKQVASLQSWLDVSAAENSIFLQTCKHLADLVHQKKQQPLPDYYSYSLHLVQQMRNIAAAAINPQPPFEPAPLRPLLLSNPGPAINADSLAELWELHLLLGRIRQDQLPGICLLQACLKHHTKLTDEDIWAMYLALHFIWQFDLHETK